MKMRLYIVLFLAFAAFSAVGVLSPDIGTVLIGILVVGLCFVAALTWYVLPGDSVKSAAAKPSGQVTIGPIEGPGAATTLKQVLESASR
jgi:hypothetical protein